MTDWGHTPEQRVAASTLRRYSIGLRVAIAQADARPVMRISRGYAPPDATMKPVHALSSWSRPSDLDKKESDGRNVPQGVAPLAQRRVVGAHEICR